MEEWIKNAFENAEKTNKVVDKAIELTEQHLDLFTPNILDAWMEQEGEDKITPLLIFILQNNLHQSISGLCARFFVSGYTLAMDDVRNKKIKP